jgi:suppressor of G2 allele of SKP1
MCNPLELKPDVKRAFQEERERNSIPKATRRVMNAAADGDKASAESNYPLAIQHYTRALSELPRAPAYYISRSTAYSRIKPADGGPNYTAALKDAETALQLARERGNREMMLSAQMRRAVTLFQLERFGDAAFLFDIVAKKSKSETEPPNKSDQVQAAMGGSSGASAGSKNNYSTQLPIWTAKIQRKLAEFEKDDPKLAVTVVEVPDESHVPTAEEMKAEWNALKAGNAQKAASQRPAVSVPDSSFAPPKQDAKTSAPATSTPTASVPAASGPAKVRHEWYQSQDSVVVTLYVKGIAKDSVAIDLKQTSVGVLSDILDISVSALTIPQVSLQFPLPSGSEYDFTLDPLYASIIPSESTVAVMNTKIEVTLRKKTAGQKWSTLESSGTAPTTTTDLPAAPKAPAPAGPSYPTSSRHGAKDWDKVASSLTGKKEKGSGTADDASDDEGDAVDGFFKKLYANADPETRRAMIKSYTESQGTSLSTNWSEVAKGKVEPHPK